jgi:hypothetical protein
MDLTPLYFLHIPKTAGSTVRVWLRDLVAEGQYFQADHPAALSDPRLRSQSYKMYLGHLGLI